MPHVLRLCLLLSMATCLHAQGFTIDVSPATRSVEPKRNAVFTIAVTTTGGFNASIFMRALAPTLNPAGVIIDPSTLNPPYTALTTVTIVPAVSEVGTHTIVIEARNGAVASYDTIVLTVTPAPGADQWKVYSKANSGLPSNAITAIGFERSGVAWIGTDAGLARAMPGEAPQAVTGPDGAGPIGAIGVDSADGVWVATTRGPSRYYNGAWVSYPVPSELLGSGSMIRSIAAAPDGAIWFGSNTGLLRFKESVWKRFATEDWGSVIPSSIAHVAVSRKGDVWVSVYAEQYAGRGILKFDGRFWTTYSLVPSGLHDHSSSAALAIDNADQVWVVTYDGLAIVSGTELIKQPAYFRSSAIASDRNGRLWVGSNWGADPEALFSQQSGPWRAHPLTDAGLSAQTRMSRLAVHPDGSVWAGTHQEGLVVLGPGSGTTGAPPADRAISFDRIDISPNPLRSGGVVNVATKGGSVRIMLHDNVGRNVATLFDGVVISGEQSLPVDLPNVPAGAYLLSVVVDGRPASSRIIVVGR